MVSVQTAGYEFEGEIGNDVLYAEHARVEKEGSSRQPLVSQVLGFTVLER